MLDMPSAFNTAVFLACEEVVLASSDDAEEDDVAAPSGTDFSPFGRTKVRPTSSEGARDSSLVLFAKNIVPRRSNATTPVAILAERVAIKPRIAEVPRTKS